MSKTLFFRKRLQLKVLISLLSSLHSAPELRFTRPDKIVEDPIPPLSDKVPLPELKYFTHDFANQGMGHKFSELLMGIYFAKRNRLQYVFNEKTFVHNFRQADLEWLGDLIRQRYPVPQELATKLNGQAFEMDLNLWIPVYNYRDTTANTYAQMNEFELRRPLLGFGGRNSYNCPEDNPRPDPNCFKADFSFFNATRDIRDLLQANESAVQGQGQHKVEQVERLAIHIRLGDITISEQPKTYVRIIEGMRRKLSISLPTNRVHFIYYQPSVWSWSNWKRLRDIKRALPDAQYHNVESTEETIRFLIASKYLMTSGSSLSFVAAYFCPNCHVISTMPKEHMHIGMEMTEDNYNHNFYYMDEWVPFIQYYSYKDESN
ncbi:hypothetical protein EC957_011202 [Mortierella hygrophila]|uniref:Uncharacterized protein n=1 Tax=Mortierella hygrophila TaxID=979708 RepID=A0A9P6JWP1_9FUNG|nr:hypothetical protein EC957_011202 [Mortierella hygrophila]